MPRSAKSAADSSPTPPMRKFARVFMNGRSQAVRLPREFRFDTDRVGIRREGRNVILSPLYEDWDDYFTDAPSVGDDFAEAMLGARRDLMPLEDRASLD